jgi:hypothetical protein
LGSTTAGQVVRRQAGFRELGRHVQTIADEMVYDLRVKLLPDLRGVFWGGEEAAVKCKIYDP